MNLTQWAIKWGIPAEALADLASQIGHDGTPTETPGPGGSEEAVQAEVRLEGSRKGLRLWRNNVGALIDERGRLVRYGLANDSKKVNARIKSGDLIGCRPVEITPDMVGQTIGQFVSRECKRRDWTYSGDEHEEAQNRWAMLVLSLGGDAAFTTGEGSL